MEQDKEEKEQNYNNKERFVGEGSGKNDTIKEQEQDKYADTEETLSNWQSARDEYIEERRKELVEKSKEMKEKQAIEKEEESEEEDTQDTLNETNVIWNESKETE